MITVYLVYLLSEEGVVRDWCKFTSREKALLWGSTYRLVDEEVAIYELQEQL